MGGFVKWTCAFRAGVAGTSLAAVACMAGAAFADGPAIRILPFGDSITYGASANLVDPSFTGGYRKPLYDLLTQAGYAVEFVGSRSTNSGGMSSTRHEGYPGYRISNWYNPGAGGLYETMWDTFPLFNNPHVVLLHIGTNDIDEGNPGEPAYSLGKLGELVDRIAAFEPGAEIVVSSLMRRATASKQTYIAEQFNPGVQTLVAEHAAKGQKVHFLDLGDCLDASDLSDDVHPTEGGYAKMAAKWFTAVTDIVSAPGWRPDDTLSVLYTVTNATTTSSVVFTMNAEMDAASVADTSHYALAGATVAAASLAADRHTVTVALATPVAVDTPQTLLVSGLANAAGTAALAANTPVRFEVSARGAAAHVPAADLDGYRRVCVYDFPEAARLDTADALYSDDIRDRVGGFSRVGYYVELREKGGSLKWLWVSMDAFTDDIGKIAIPTRASGAFFDQLVSNLVIRSNHPGVTPGERATGNLEFWPWNYSYGRGGVTLPGGSESLGDFDDSPSVNNGNFGSFQIHDYENGRTLFSWTKWGGFIHNGCRGDGAFTNLGIGNAPSGNPDWTFTATNPTTPQPGGARSYDIRRLEVYVMSDVRPPAPRPVAEVPLRIMPLGDSITWGYNVPGGYRAPLHELLAAAGYNATFCGSQTANSSGMASPRHEGHSGYRLSNNYCPSQNGLLENLPAWFGDANCLNPHIVLLHAGTNDGNDGPDNLRAHGLRNLGLLVDRIAELQPGADIVVTTLLPRDYGRNGSDHSNEAIQDTFNPGLPALVAEHAAKGQKVHYFDLGRYVTLDDLADGCHPNAAGYAKLAQGWFDCITNLLPAASLYVPDDTPAVVSTQIADGTVTFTMNQAMGAGAANPACYSVNVPGVTVASVSVLGRTVSVRLASGGTVGEEVVLTAHALPNADGTYSSARVSVPLYLAAPTVVTDGGVVVPRDGRVVVDVAAGETREQTVPIVQEGRSRLVKTGEGTWQLPLTAFRQNAPVDIQVRGGTVELTKGGMLPSYAKPTALLNRAQFWISAKDDTGNASDKVVVTNGPSGGAFVARWCDERETNLAAPTRRYADPAWSEAQYTSVMGEPPTLEEKDGRPSVYFGGYTSGKFMPIMQNGQAAELSGIREIFCVHGAFSTYGYVLGNYSVPDREGHNSYINPATKTFSGSTGIWLASNIVAGPDREGFTTVDGAYVPDPVRTTFARGFHLFSVKSGRENGYLGGFFTNRRYQDRQGGDYLNEVVAFDFELAPAERAQVQQYLMQKWGLLPAAGDVKGRIRLAAGTTLKVNTDEIAPGAFSIEGAGTVETTGSGALDLDALKDFTGVVRLTAASATTAKSVEIDYAPRAGERVAATVALRAATLVSAGDAGAGQVRLQGNATVRATAVDADVSKIAVEGGELALAAPAAPRAGVLAPGAEAVITNADFEANFAIGGLGPSLNKVDAKYGWFEQGAHGYWWSEDGYSFNLGSYLATGNRRYLDIQNDAGNEALVYTRLTIPRAGVYELSFDGCGRENFDRYMNEVKAGPSLGSLQTLARFKYQRLGPFVRAAWRIPWAEAGDYVVGVKALTMPQGAGGTLLDNFRLDFVTDVPDASVWKIPNGDFELLTNVESARDAHSYANIQNTAEGWTFDNGSYTGGGDPNVGVWVNGMYGQSGHTYYQPNYASETAAKGVVQLFFADVAGRARTTFRPPAGTWRLRADTAICPMYFRGGWQWNRRSDALQATVTVGGAAIALGTCSVTTMAMTPGTWPTAFTVDGATDVTLELRQPSDQYGSLLADNFELVRVDGDARNYVQDGGFEAASQSSYDAAINSAYWRTAQNKGAQRYSYVYPVNYATYYPDQIGSSTCAGAQYAIVCGTAYMEQDLDLDAAGVYVFRMHTATRYNQKDGGRTDQGLNPLKAYIYPAGGDFASQAVEIGAFAVETFEFVPRTAYFRVPSAGRWTLRIAGQSAQANCDRIARVDEVSVTKTAFAADVPDVPETAQVSVAAGAKLRLDYPGTIRLDRLELGGRGVSGTVTAARYPDYISGPGAVEVRAKATVILFR